MFEDTLRYLLIGAIVIVVYLISRVFKILDRQKKDMVLVLDKVYWLAKLEKELHRSEVQFPIIWFGGEFLEPVQFMSTKDFYLPYQTWSASLVDADGQKWTPKKVSAKELWITDKRVVSLTMEKLEMSAYKQSFLSLKDTIIHSTRSNKESAYVKVIDAIEQSSTMQELASAMSKWSY